MLPYFLEQARDLRARADRARALGGPTDDPAGGLWREAACCHVLLAAGRGAAAVARLRYVYRAATGAEPGAPRPTSGETGHTAIATDLFARVRAALDRRTAA